MSLRDAFEQSRFLTLAILVAIAWTVFSVARVLGQFNFWVPETVGADPVAGVVGVLVMGVGVVFALALLSASEHGDPGPEAWPPEDA